MSHEDAGPPKRSDVGYKRPPVEHQFKPGNKPKRRKAKPPPAEPSMGELLWTILQEDVQTVSGRRVIWMSKAEAVYRKAHELADRNNPAMRRLIMDLMLRTESPDEQDSVTERWFWNGVEHPASGT
jgi:hypothetical protein